MGFYCHICVTAAKLTPCAFEIIICYPIQNSMWLVPYQVVRVPVSLITRFTANFFYSSNAQYSA